MQRDPVEMLDGLMSNPRCLAVMYHYVRDRAGTPERDIRGLDVDTFTRQIDTLCDLLTPIDWPTFVAWHTGRKQLAHDAFLLTFDDGLADHAEVVQPILESRGLRGVFFVHTEVLTDIKMSAAHQLHLLMCKLSPEQLSYAVPGTVDTDTACRIYHYETPKRARLKYLLNQVLPLDRRDRIIEDLFAQHIGDSRQYASRWYMSWDQLAAMQTAGHTIGGHGHRHVPYARLTASEQVDDLSRCASVLRDSLGAGPRPFSYPYGSFDHDTAQRCAQAGFVNGFTTQSGWIKKSKVESRKPKKEFRCGIPDFGFRLSTFEACRMDTIHVDALIEREFACVQL